MRSLSFVLGAAVLAACSKPDAPPPAVPAPPAATVNLADAAGTWTLSVMGESSDSVLLTNTIVASADPAAWTLTLPGRAPMALRVSISGDSIITEAGPYESVLRPGVQVSTRSAMRLENGQMVGTTVARYSGGGADSVRVLRTRGTRNP
jgi:hypothetical protein